ncbi:MAG: GAF domain-containing protein [Gammaproteobacteria bacterium]
MKRSFAFQTSITLLLLAGGVLATWGAFNAHDLPFSLSVVDARTAVIHPNPGTPLPPGIQAGDRVDLQALDPSTRAALVIYDMQGTLPAEKTYPFVIHRGDMGITIPVTTVRMALNQRARISNWLFLGNFLLVAILGLLVLWRGRDRAAGLMAIWLMLTVTGFAFNYGFATDGSFGLWMQSLAVADYSFGRVCFYLMIETIVGEALTARARLIARVCFALVLAAGISALLGGHLLYALTSWAGLMNPAYGILFTAGYFVPALLLIYSYSHATQAQKPHLRWLLLSLAFLLVAIFLSNTSVMDIVTTLAVQSAFIGIGYCGFAYTVLRHRVVDVTVVLDRTLVYGTTTALVVGIVAAMNSVALRVTLGANTGLLLQIVIPLALGIVLGKLRTYMDTVVERVFFRRKYLADKALRTFARQAGHMESSARLLDAAAREIQRHMRAPAVAIYSAEKQGYQMLRRAGEDVFPERLDIDDAALVAIRTERAAVELPDVGSALGNDGCVFPMIVLGNLRGAVVLLNRPSEHYVTDERELLTQVASDVGAALRILRARDNETIVEQLADGKVPARTLRDRARAIRLARVGA